MTNNFQMHVKQRYLGLLHDGSKSVEFRLNDEKRKAIKVGDKICFICHNNDNRFVVLSVADIVYSSEFADIIKNINPSLLGGISPQQQLRELEEIYDRDSINKHGVLALILKRAS